MMVAGLSLVGCEPCTSIGLFRIGLETGRLLLVPECCDGGGSGGGGGGNGGGKGLELIATGC